MTSYVKYAEYIGKREWRTVPNGYHERLRFKEGRIEFFASWQDKEFLLATISPDETIVFHVEPQPHMFYRLMLPYKVNRSPTLTAAYVVKTNIVDSYVFRRGMALRLKDGVPAKNPIFPSDLYAPQKELRELRAYIDERAKVITTAIKMMSGIELWNPDMKMPYRENAVRYLLQTDTAESSYMAAHMLLRGHSASQVEEWQITKHCRLLLKDCIEFKGLAKPREK